MLRRSAEAGAEIFVPFSPCFFVRAQQRCVGCVLFRAGCRFFCGTRRPPFLWDSAESLFGTAFFAATFVSLPTMVMSCTCVVRPPCPCCAAEQLLWTEVEDRIICMMGTPCP